MRARPRGVSHGTRRAAARCAAQCVGVRAMSLECVQCASCACKKSSTHSSKVVGRKVAGTPLAKHTVAHAPFPPAACPCPPPNPPQPSPLPLSPWLAISLAMFAFTFTFTCFRACMHWVHISAPKGIPRRRVPFGQLLLFSPPPPPPRPSLPPRLPTQVRPWVTECVRAPCCATCARACTWARTPCGA